MKTNKPAYIILLIIAMTATITAIAIELKPELYTNTYEYFCECKI